MKVIGLASEFKSLLRSLHGPAGVLLRYAKPRKHQRLVDFFSRQRLTLTEQLTVTSDDERFCTLAGPEAVRSQVKALNRRFARTLVEL